MKFEVHDKQNYIVNKVEKGAAGKIFRIFIVKTEVSGINLLAPQVKIFFH